MIEADCGATSVFSERARQLFAMMSARARTGPKRSINSGSVPVVPSVRPGCFVEGEQIMSQAGRGTSPSTAWREDLLDDEQKLFQDFAAEIRKLQEKVADGGTLRRGFHNKIHAGLRAEFC